MTLNDRVRRQKLAYILVVGHADDGNLGGLGHLAELSQATTVGSGHAIHLVHDQRLHSTHLRSA